MMNKNKINLLIAFLGFLFISGFFGNTAIKTKIVLGDMYIFQSEIPQQEPALVEGFLQFGDQHYFQVSKEFESLKKASVKQLEE
ncbi:hypothetical protein R9C00_16545 [Flammeovirgaceae bacterium SG7u.111]|nr:hypothetical protein [Flammeovirgaceae bacterium SG7u.132]WPO33312.1 hypothetical protein R9C00_16545 [Flammeovirgaceae bacterium SG7u.111]